jgi:hypothetical protein
LDIDLGETKIINEIQVWNRLDCCSNRLTNAYVMVSSTVFPTSTNLSDALNNASFTYQIGDATGLAQMVIPTLVSGRYVRLQRSGPNPSNGGNAINIAEFQVFGEAICNTDTATSEDKYNLDSDSDGCPDTLEAGFTDPDGDLILGTSPVSVDVNGIVTGQGGYTTPADLDANSIFDFKEFGETPTITIQPISTRIFSGSNGIFSITATAANQYQWQESSDGGANYTDIVDGTEYAGAFTSSLTVLSVALDKNGYMYRAILSHSSFICEQTQSNAIILTVGPRTVLTNRRITVRVKN